MLRSTVVVAFLLCLSNATPLVAADVTDADISGDDAVTISQSMLMMGEKHLELHYRIRNDAHHDIWLCDNVAVGESTECEAYLTDQGRTIKIRRCATMDWADQSVMRNDPLCCYRRLRAGEHRDEVVFLPLPFRPQTVWASSHVPSDVESVSKLIFESGYYSIDSPAAIPRTFSSDEEMGRTHDEFYAGQGELPRDRERILRLSVDGIRIPCADSLSQSWSPELAMWTRLEISWHPSALEYFFPHGDQQSLLSATELESLSSTGALSVTDEETMEAFAADIIEGVNAAVAVGGAKGRITCYRDAKHMASFDVYDNALVTERGESFIFADFYRTGFPSLRRIAPQIRVNDLRLACRNNLDRLHTRWRFRGSEKEGLPVLDQWCDEIVNCFTGVYVKTAVYEPFRCPSAGDGKCHYAMNPDCGPESAGDMVLLFETKAGWNQHGRAELFTFDNHDPKGGCVLLNNGTVKFIRTEDELHALRWK